MKKTNKTSSDVAAVIADLVGVPRRKLAKDIEALQKPKRTIWVMKEANSGCYLFYSHYNPNPLRHYMLGDIDTLLLGAGLLYANTRKELVAMHSIKRFAKETGFKFKPVRITVEIREEK